MYVPKLFRFLALKFYDIRHPLPVRPYGIFCYVGLPGAGKTLSMVEKLDQLRTKFPAAKIYTNFGYAHQHGSIFSWRDFIDLENGTDGVIFGFDEIQNVFNSREWSDFPPEMMSLITQNRKYAKMFLCTAQSFATIDANFRRICQYIIECRTIGRRWVFQRAFLPDSYSEKDSVFVPRFRAWTYSFIADNALYDSYDSFAIIRSIRQAGGVVRRSSVEGDA